MSARRTARSSTRAGWRQRRTSLHSAPRRDLRRRVLDRRCSRRSSAMVASTTAVAVERRLCRSRIERAQRSAERTTSPASAVRADPLGRRALARASQRADPGPLGDGRGLAPGLWPRRGCSGGRSLAQRGARSTRRAPSRTPARRRGRSRARVQTHRPAGGSMPRGSAADARRDDVRVTACLATSARHRRLRTTSCQRDARLAPYAARAPAASTERGRRCARTVRRPPADPHGPSGEPRRYAAPAESRSERRPTSAASSAEVAGHRADPADGDRATRPRMRSAVDVAVQRRCCALP